MATTIGIISPGDMGHAIGRAIMANNNSRTRVITNLTNRSQRTKILSDSAGILDVFSDEALLNEADIILSIVTPSAASMVASRFASKISSTKRNTIYVDMNAIAPQTVCSIGTMFPDDNFVDGSIVGLPPRIGEYTPSIYLSGKHAHKVSEALKFSSALRVQIIGEQIGQASGLKMCYASISKGITAIAIHACVTARSLNLEDAFLDELQKTMPHVFGMMKNLIPDMAPKAARWVGEMEEIAKTNEQIGLSPKLFEGAADTYRFVAERTPLGKEVIENRKRGKSLADAVDIMAECLNNNKNIDQD